MKHTQRKIISTIKSAMKEGTLAAGKKHNVSEATIYEWCKKAGVQPAKDKPSVNWEEVKNTVINK